ncbi:MAG: hypothetical protein II176_07555 [Selenomonas sp.]|nr:hypothetical protein [Selenomonas sp.]
MDSFWVIVLFILFAVLSDRTGKKKPVPKRRVPDLGRRPLPDISGPESEPEQIKLEIPELRGAPPLPEINTSVHVQAEDEIAAQQARYQEMLRQKRKREQQAARETEAKAAAQRHVESTPSLNDMQQAVVWAEILGKPRALQRRR